MAHHKSAIKRNRQNEKRRVRNRHYKTMMRNATKRFRVAISEDNINEAKSLFPKVTQLIQRAGQKGVIHKRQASRRVKRLHHALKGLELKGS